MKAICENEIVNLKEIGNLLGNAMYVINEKEKLTSKESYNLYTLYKKQAIKSLNRSLAIFSMEEKRRAETCKEGLATQELINLAFRYFNNSYLKDYRKSEYIDMLIKARPSTYLLTRPTKLFNSTNRPYFNKYFASWWYKKNWKDIVTKWIDGDK